jgi:hypothetical protein
VIFGALSSIGFRLCPAHEHIAGDQPQVILVIYRCEIEENLDPAAHSVHARHRRHEHARDVGHVVQAAPHFAIGARPRAKHAPAGFFCADNRQILNFRMRSARAVHEGDVHFIHAVLKALEIIAGHRLDVPQIDKSVRPLARVWRELRRIAFAEVGKDQAHVLARRVASGFDFLSKAGILRGLLDALAGAVELPPMIDAANVITFYPSEMQLRAAMRAAVVHDLRAA